MQLPPLLIQKLERLEGAALSGALRFQRQKYILMREDVNGELWAKNQRDFYTRCIKELELMQNGLQSETSSENS